MARDYAFIVRTLRAKADSTDSPEEAKQLREKADELEQLYLANSEQIIITGRLPHVTPEAGPFARPPGWYDQWLDSLVDERFLFDDE
jgi:hypothetical protein